MLRIDHFEDADEAAAAIADVDARFVVRRPPEGEWSLVQLALERDARFLQGRFASALCANVVIDPRMVTVAWPIDGRRAHAWSVNGREVRGGHVAVIDGGLEHAVLTERPLRWAALQVPRQRWPSHRDAASIQVARLPATTARSLAEWQGSILEHAATGLRTFTHSRWEQMLEDLIVPYVRSAGVRGHGRTAREALLDKLNKFLRTHGSEVLHPSDLQRLLNLGPRALRQFFQDNYGMSVGRFLRLRRLNNAYRDLRDGRYESRPVTEVAIKHGFYDLGRFASAYEDVFAELPSETARRSRRR